MSDIHAVFKLPDHAGMAYFAIRELQTIDTDALCQILGKSAPSIYRSLAVLRRAGLIESKRSSIYKLNPQNQATC